MRKIGGQKKILALAAVSLAIGIVVFGGFEDKDEARKKRNHRISAAIELGASGEYKRAVVLLGGIVDEFPEDTVALYNYGTALRAIKELTKADAVFQSLLLLSPDDHEAWVERASIAVLQNDLDRAFDFLDKVPRGKGNLILRLRSDPKWKEFESHPRMKKVRAQQGLNSLKY
jgi:tetratricopeptide (TPR) repeat protein